MQFAGFPGPPINWNISVLVMAGAGDTPLRGTQPARFLLFEQFLKAFLPALGAGDILNYIFRQEKEHLTQKQLHFPPETQARERWAGEISIFQLMRGI